MKAFPMIIIAILCLAFGWFAHYTIVPETTYVTDTLMILDTMMFVELSEGSPYRPLELDPWGVVIIKSMGSFESVNEDLFRQNMIGTDGDTIRSYFYRKAFPIFDSVPHPHIPEARNLYRSVIGR